MCSEVLEHIPEPQLAIQEFGRIIRSGGVLLLTAPFSSLTHFSPYHYCTGFNIYWYQYHFAKQGFEIDEAIPNGDFFAYIHQELLRLPYMSSKYLHKRSLLLKLEVGMLAHRLKRMSATKNNSDEVINFGYCIKAHKR